MPNDCDSKSIYIGGNFFTYFLCGLIPISWRKTFNRWFKITSWAVPAVRYLDKYDHKVADE